MRSHQPGPITEHLWYLGREESGVYLLRGDREDMLISGGLCYLIPDVLRQLSDFSLDLLRIRKILVLHAHFDHIGLIPHIFRQVPEVEIYASARGWDILSQPKAIATINAFSRLVADRMGRLGGLDRYDWEWRQDVKGTVVTEGDRIVVGESTVQVFATPGHSSCSLSAYIPEIKALFPSDGGGVPFRGAIIPTGNSNYTHFQASLRKLHSLPVTLIGSDHYGYAMGGEAEGYFAAAIAEADRKRQAIEGHLHETGSLEVTVEKMLRDTYTDNPDYFLAPEIYAGVFRQMVRHIAAALDPPLAPGNVKEPRRAPAE